MIVDHPHSLASDISRSSLNSAARSRAGVRAWRRGWLLLLAGCAVALQAAAPAGWPTTVDVDPGETVTAVRNGVPHTFRILNDAQGQPAITHETMPFPTISPDYRVNYAARVRLLVDGQEVEVVARPLQYPIDAAGLRLYLDGTQEWLEVGIYAVAIPKRLRLRFTAAGESWGPATLRFPVGDYRWYATTYNNTWLGIVPQGVETTYYHKGEDFGAVPERLPVFAPEAGTVTTSEWSVQFTAADGTITRMFHMNPPTIVVTAGQTLAAGQLLGLTGQYGNGNSDPHLHYDFRWDGDEPGTYPFAADAYLRDYPDAGIPVAGGYQFMFAGDTLTLDGRRSLARPGRTITGYRWILHDGTVVDGPTAALTPSEPGFYSEELRVFFDDGRQERGFTAVRAFARGAAGQMPITGLVYEYPVRGITPGSQVTIGHYPFGEGGNERTIDFGDGSPVETVYGYQPTVAHAYAAPGLYTVTIRTVGGMKQILKTSVLVEPFGSGPNHAPTIAGPAARQWRCFADAEFAVALAATDVDGDPLDWSVARPAVHGAAEVGPDGLVRYRPAAGFIGADTFAIKVDDGRSGFASVECSVVVAAVPIIGAAGARIEAEDYDEGAGVGYHDADSRQGTSTVRAGGWANEVDLVAMDSGADSPGMKVGYTVAGEWLRYTAVVPITATYKVRLRVANGTGAASPNAVSLRWKGTVIAGPLTVPSTGGWDLFTDLDVPGVVLAAGPNQLQVDCVTGGFDLNWLELTPAGPTWAPVVSILALTFQRARGIAVVAEISDDLVTWTSDAANLVQVGTAVPDVTGLNEAVTFRSTATTTAKPRQFLRVRVTLP
ncbi:MAG: peptidoglycan DD-metalloendopeptidase family protein [Opitutaceae bacterium]|nr:peptidoglycan DD-metalloendopeptidase family protein [Opitutaceae bacterium]